MTLYWEQNTEAGRAYVKRNTRRNLKRLEKNIWKLTNCLNMHKGYGLIFVISEKKLKQLKFPVRGDTAFNPIIHFYYVFAPFYC